MLAGSEFNFYVDAEAAHIVLQSLICPVTILPLECGEENKISLVFKIIFFLSHFRIYSQILFHRIGGSMYWDKLTTKM